MKLDWHAARAPARVALDGRLVRLEPIDVDRHCAQLFAASSSAPGLWEHLPYGPFANERDFEAWLRGCAATDDPLFYAIVDRESGEAGGMASYLRIVPEHGVIEIGHIWFAPIIQRTREATEAIFVMARHAFDELGHRRLEWKCDALNERSRRAALRFGFTYEGVFRQHLVVKGRNRDSAWYSMLDREWPLIRAAFETWLGADNFEAGGEQRRALASIREELTTRPS